jgi:glycosyltransferase involved in cell wall biosynthesis
MVKRQHLESDVVFTGLVGQEKIPELIRAMDVLVHTSLREGLPRAVVQALVLEKPVVSFDVDGAKEVVLDGITGYLIPPCNSNALAAAIHKLIDNPETRYKMGKKGKELFIEQFSWQKMVEEIEKLYHELVQKRIYLDTNF